MKTSLLLGGLAALAMTSSAFAQSSQNPAIPAYNAPTLGAVTKTDNSAPVLSQDHSSTIVEGARRSAADYQRALGDRAYNESLSNINNEEARSRSIDNAKRFTQTYFEMRRINREATAAEATPRLTPEQLVKIAKQMTPVRMTAYQLNPVSGTINWPAILQYDEFAKQREALNKLFANRDSAAGLGSPTNRAVIASTNEMFELLKGHIDDVSANEFVQGKKFIDSLAYESQFAPGAVAEPEATNR